MFWWVVAISAVVAGNVFALIDLNRRASELEKDVSRLVAAIQRDRAIRAPLEHRLEVLEQWHRGDYDRS